MKAVAVLCGGRGTRLGYDGQKCLALVAGRPFLAWKLDQLYDAGATELHFLVSHRADEIMDWYDYYYEPWCPATFHFDDGSGPVAAHKAAARSMPFAHWLTYGDCLLDVPLRHSLLGPYLWSNDEFADAGVLYCWGANSRFRRRHTESRSFHINTPQDLEKTGAHLHRLRVAR